MKISRSQIEQVLQTMVAKPGAPRTEKPHLRSVGGAGDQVAMSTATDRMRQLCQMIAELPDVRPERVQEITTALERGEYNPTSAEIAEKMLGRIIADQLK